MQKKKIKNLKLPEIIIPEFFNDAEINGMPTRLQNYIQYKIEKYVAKEYSGSPIRLKVFVDNGKFYDLPLDAEAHLGVEIKAIQSK